VGSRKDVEIQVGKEVASKSAESRDGYRVIGRVGICSKLDGVGSVGKLESWRERNGDGSGRKLGRK
jgi:hypothetical protein